MNRASTDPPLPVDPSHDGLADLHWLISSEAHPWLQWLAEQPRSLVAQTTHLRRSLSPARAHLVLEQFQLRQKGLSKFADAGSLFFTPRGLEQATDQHVAGYKAQRFPTTKPLADLCCGIGGDALALARQAPIVAVDRDPAIALLAEANLRHVHALAGQEGDPAEVLVQDVLQTDLQSVAAWHIDPDRRPQGHRTTKVELHEPGVDVLEAMLSTNPNGAVKLAPAAQWPETWNERAEFEWISRARQCRQLVAWFGNLARSPGKRRATFIDASGSAHSLSGLPLAEPLPLAPIGHFLFESDPAVLAAGLGEKHAADHALCAVQSGIAYWTGDSALDDPLMACFEVEEVLPYRRKTLQQALQARGVGPLEIKKRGVDLEPQQVRQQLRLSGHEARTVLLLPLAKQVVAVIARRHGHVMTGD